MANDGRIYEYKRKMDPLDQELIEEFKALIEKHGINKALEHFLAAFVDNPRIFWALGEAVDWIEGSPYG